jgi:hypothetical protein
MNARLDGTNAGDILRAPNLIPPNPAAAESTRPFSEDIISTTLLYGVVVFITGSWYSPINSRHSPAETFT